LTEIVAKTSKNGSNGSNGSHWEITKLLSIIRKHVTKFSCRIVENPQKIKIHYVKNFKRNYNFVEISKNLATLLKVS